MIRFSAFDGKANRLYCVAFFGRIRLPGAGCSWLGSSGERFCQTRETKKAEEAREFRVLATVLENC